MEVISIEIKVKRDIDANRKDALGVDNWSPWSKEESRFEWSYSDTETCYVIAGEVTVETDDGSIVISAGDVAQFPEGLSCVWDIHSDLRKVFTFDPVELDPDESTTNSDS